MSHGDGLNAEHRSAELNTSVRISRLTGRVVRGFAVNYPTALARSNSKALSATPRRRRFTAVSGVRCSRCRALKDRTVGRSSGAWMTNRWQCRRRWVVRREQNA